MSLGLHLTCQVTWDIQNHFTLEANRLFYLTFLTTIIKVGNVDFQRV